MVHGILDDIILEIMDEYEKKIFVEEIFTTIFHIIQKIIFIKR